MNNNTPILYSFYRCPYAIRARISLVHYGINCIIREVNLREKPQAMLEISPKGTVPVLYFEEEKRTIDESLDIVYYALKHNEDSTLAKYTLANEEQVQELLYNNDTHFVKLLKSYKYPEKFTEFTKEIAREEIETQFLAKYEKMLGNSDFLIGSYSVADICILPFIRQFAFVDPDWFFNSKYKKLIQWLNNSIESKEFKDVVMRKNHPWHPEDHPIYLLRSK